MNPQSSHIHGHRPRRHSCSGTVDSRASFANGTTERLPRSGLYPHSVSVGSHPLNLSSRISGTATRLMQVVKSHHMNSIGGFIVDEIGKAMCFLYNMDFTAVHSIGLIRQWGLFAHSDPEILTQGIANNIKHRRIRVKVTMKQADLNNYRLQRLNRQNTDLLDGSSAHIGTSCQQPAT